MLVTVTPVNEYPPACPVHSTFSVREDAAFGYIIGFVNGTDWDYPFNSIIYSLVGDTGGSLPDFYIGPWSGEEPWYTCVLGSWGQSEHSPFCTSHRNPTGPVRAPLTHSDPVWGLSEQFHNTSPLGPPGTHSEHPSLYPRGNSQSTLHHIPQRDGTEPVRTFPTLY